jgi:hypothetical protein
MYLHKNSMMGSLFKRKVIKLRWFWDNTFKKDIFPLPKNDSGNLPAHYEQNGKLCCPNCGETNGWSIHGFLLLECNVCFRYFENFGSYGLRPVDRPKTIDSLDKIDINMTRIF